MKAPRHERDTLAAPTVVAEGDSTATPSAGSSEPPEPPLLYVRALDAFEAFYRQLGVVSQLRAELRAWFDTDKIPLVVMAAAGLNCALGVLYARLELLEVVTNDDAGRDLWTHPMMELMRAQLLGVVEEGTAYALRHPEGWRVLEQLHHLAVTLAVEAKVAVEVVGRARASDEHPGAPPADDLVPDQHVAIIVDRSRAGLIRCRMRRPWRRQARRMDRRREPQ